MSLAEATAISAFRSLSIALAALPLMRLLCRALRAPGRVAMPPSLARRALWAAVLAPLFTPGLLPAYAWSNFRIELFGTSISLVHHPFWNEAVYSLLVAMTAVPAGTIVLYFAPPPPLSAEARHCRRLLLGPQAGLVRRAALELRLWTGGDARSLLPAGAVVFLIAFQEFEIGSLMSVTAGTSATPVTWTGKLFEMQQLVPSAGQTLRMAVLPVSVELAVIVPVMASLICAGRPPAAPSEPAKPAGLAVTAIAWMWAGAAVLIVLAVPAVTVLEDVPAGFASLAGRPSLGRALGASAAFAIAAGLFAWLAAAIALRWGRSGSARGGTLAALCLALPGLVGSLVLSLTLLAAFQHGLPMFYDRPLPLELALVLFLVPRALLVQLLLRASTQREALHAAALLKAAPDAGRRSSAAELHWRTIGRGRFWGVALLCHWAWWDLTAPAVLIPAGLDTAPMLLYRLMHYGRNDVYSAMLCITLLTPPALIAAAWALRRLFRPR